MENAFSFWINHLQLSEKLKQHFTAAENMTDTSESSALQDRWITKTEY